MTKDKHILVDEPTRKELKIRAAKNGTSIGDIVKRLLIEKEELEIEPESEE